jgi:RNA-splicing ligase RtcB
MSRTAAFKQLSMEQYKAEMQGIFTTSVQPGTLDESPMAYKPIKEIIAHISPTADIVARIKPVYNFKAAEQSRRRKR